MQVPIRSAAAQRDYYSSERADGTLDQTLETMIALAFDGPGSDLVRKLLRRDPLDRDERAHLAAYVAFLHGWVPLAREGAFDMMSKIATFMEYSHLKAMTPAKFIDFAKERGLQGTDKELATKQSEILAEMKSGKIYVGPDNAATMIGASIAVESVAPILSAMHWTILQASIGFEFVIGDSPVTRFSEAAMKNRYYRWGLGFGGPDIEVRVPLTMSHALLMTPVRTGVTELECRAEVMKNVNAISWRFAHRYVFASREAALRRVASYFDTEDDRRQPGGLGEVLGADLE